MEALPGRAHVGITSVEIQKRIVTYYMDEGADLGSGPPIALGATGPGGAFQAGDVLYLDGGCGFEGYQMDFTRRAVFGAPSDRQRREHDGMWEILSRSWIAWSPEPQWRKSSNTPSRCWRRPGSSTIRIIGEADRSRHRAGNRTALDQPVRPDRAANRMTLTPEPKIESPDGLVNPEEHVAIREHGCEILSTDPGWELFVVE